MSSLGKWSNEDTAANTGSSTSQAAAAGHAARDDAEKAGVFERGNDAKNSERFSRDDDSGRAATSLWDSIFGGKK